jgi:hypothetical protein
MIDQRNKCEHEILFKISKKEADFVRNMPRYLQAEFEKYLRLKQKLALLFITISNSK